MALEDPRGLGLNGATPDAAARYEQALGAYLSFRGTPAGLLAPVLAETPQFTMAHVFAAYLALGGRDPDGVTRARIAVAPARVLAADEREHAHVAAIEALAGGDWERARHVLGDLLAAHPRDVLALAVAHAWDYQQGDAQSLHTRIERVMPAWSAETPGYHAVLAMHAFGLEEAGHYAKAQEQAHAALELNPWDIRAHHAVAHVFEMLDRPADGIRWANERTGYWDDGSAVAIHNWWHVALFHLRQSHFSQALAIYDWRIRPQLARGISALIDASALLWRLQLLEIPLGRRWQELAVHWSSHAEDAYCAFSDIHAMMAFIGAERHSDARRLMVAMRRRAAGGGANAAMTRFVGLPVCNALVAWRDERHDDSERILRELPALSHRIGGSRAQQSIVALTLEHARQRTGFARAA